MEALKQENAELKIANGNIKLKTYPSFCTKFKHCKLQL
jgi:hypothetical protein